MEASGHLFSPDTLRKCANWKKEDTSKSSALSQCVWRKKIQREALIHAMTVNNEFIRKIREDPRLNSFYF
jgi:hypothetical protein